MSLTPYPLRRRFALVLGLAAAAALVLSLAASATIPVVKIATDPFTNSTSQHKTIVEPDSFFIGSTGVVAAQSGRFFDGGSSDIAEFLALEQPTVPGRRRRGRAQVEGMDRGELEKLVIQLEEEMFAAAEELRFEYAAKLRDEIKELRRELVALAEAPA